MLSDSPTFDGLDVDVEIGWNASAHALCYDLVRRGTFALFRPAWPASVQIVLYLPVGG